MKLFITAARVGKDWTILSGPSSDYGVQKDLFKQLRASGGVLDEKRFEEVVMLERSLQAKFPTEADLAARKERHAKDTATFAAAEAERQEAHKLGITVPELRDRKKPVTEDGATDKPVRKHKKG